MAKGLRKAPEKGFSFPQDLRPHSWYLVEVSFGEDNMVHEAMMYTGFAYEGMPGGNDYGQENIKRFAQAALRRPVGVESEAR